MSQIENVEAAEKWTESVDRVLATANALKYNLKAFREGGASADDNWAAIEASRLALKAAMREEQARYVKAIEPPAQQSMPGMDEPRGPRALPASASAAHVE